MLSNAISSPVGAGVQRTKNKGFTLIELMITVAILGILAAVAYPSYLESVNKGKRADALRALTEAEQYMRRYYSTRDTYDDVTLPTGLDQVPKTGNNPYYEIKFLIGTDMKDTSENDSTFTLIATRKGSMANDACGDLTVNQSGKRELKSNSTSKTLSDCFPGS